MQTDKIYFIIHLLYTDILVFRSLLWPRSGCHTRTQTIYNSYAKCTAKAARRYS